MVYDPIAAAKGLAHAFDSQRAADVYGTTLKSPEMRRAAATIRPGMSRYIAAALPSGCPDAKNISRMYDLTRATGVCQ